MVTQAFFTEIEIKTYSHSVTEAFVLLPNIILLVKTAKQTVKRYFMSFYRAAVSDVVN